MTPQNMPALPVDLSKVSFHSADFERMTAMSFINEGAEPQIHGKSRDGWETEWAVVGGIEHLKTLGWSISQWRYKAPTISENLEIPHCFAEFFGPHYHGYLRGDGLTVLDAVNICVQLGQKMARCERRNGHDYLVRRGGGLIECQKCHFHGYSNQVETLQSEARNLRIHNQILQEENARLYESMRWEGYRLSLKSGFEIFEKIPGFVKSPAAEEEA